MSLPLLWVDSLFTRLAIRYGDDWIRKWNGVDIKLVKADWAHELGGFHAAPEAIAHALEHMPPDHPPTVTQFRTLCCGAPKYIEKQIPSPKADTTPENSNPGVIGQPTNSRADL